MNRSRLIKITVLPLLIASAVFGLTGCKIIGISDYCYDDYDKYIVGAANLTETIENINIDWLVGNVKVMSHTANTISFFENSEKELKEDMKLRYYLDDTTLRIRFCSCGKWNLSKFDKDLTVLVPDTLTISNMELNSLSANVNLSNCDVTQSVKFNTLSGELEAEFINPLNEFKGNSTSGSFKITAPSISRFNANTVSGEVSMSVMKEPEWLDIDTTSGNINLVLPESASFTLNYDTKSGDLALELPYSKSDEKYIFKEGKNEYKIVTVSGDVFIKTNV